MSVETYNLGWLPLNEQRAYPLAESASRTDTTGTFKLPDSFLVALYVTLDAKAPTDPLAFYVSRVVNSPGVVVVTVSHWDGATAAEFGSFSVPSATHAEFDPYQITVKEAFAGSSARAVVGLLSEMRIAPAGAFGFGPEAGRLDPDCVRPSLRGLADLVVVNGSDVSEPITGRVTLVAGTNMRISIAAGPTETTVRFDAVQGEGLFADCGCADDDALAPCVRTISGVSADSTGNIDLVSGECVDIAPSGNGLVLSDTCAKPCCGSAQLEAITTDLQRIASQQTSLSNFVNRLETLITGLNMVVLGSRLGDEGCTT